MGTKPRKGPSLVRLASRVDVARDEGRQPSLADALFTSTQRHVLACLFGEPERAFYLRELLAITGAGHGAVQREVRRLERAGLIKSDRRGNRRYLQADATSPVHDELVALVRKTVGLAEPLREAFGAARAHADLCIAFEPERDPWCPGQRDLGLLFVGAREPPHGLLEHGRELAEQHLRRSIFMVTANPERLRTDRHFAQLMHAARICVFGDEASAATARGPPPRAV